jgi:hypothetical protein
MVFRSCMMVPLLWSIMSVANMCSAADDAKADSAPPSRKAEPRKKAIGLVIAIEAWIVALEKDDLAAAKKWTESEKAAKQLEDEWKNLRGAHAKHNYRKWLEKAKDAVDEFKVGGHEFEHMHTDWKKTDAGWRIHSVTMCW